MALSQDRSTDKPEAIEIEKLIFVVPGRSRRTQRRNHAAKLSEQTSS
jgi:hypothetical protein